MTIDLPDYRVLDKLGDGANSHIYCVEHVQTGALRAAKYVQVRNEDEKKYIDQLKAELAAGQIIDHPTLRKVYELIYVRRRLKLKAAVLMMEYVDGLPMSHSAFRPEVLDLLGYFHQAAQGLHVMHRAGFVHADLKPGNLIVTTDGNLKLIDFGQSSAMLQAKERIQGTIDYMAPEQARRSVLDQRTDVFGFGATLYKVLTGRAIATEMNRTAGLHAPTRIGRRASEFARAATVEIPPPVAKLIEDCCRDDPMERLADMRAVISRIELTQAILERRAAEGPAGQRKAPKTGPAAAAAPKGPASESTREEPDAQGANQRGSTAQKPEPTDSAG